MPPDDAPPRTTHPKQTSCQDRDRHAHGADPSQVSAETDSSRIRQLQARQLITDKVADWTALRRELQAANPGRGLCFLCGQGTLAGRGPVNHVVHGLFAHAICQGD